MEILKDIPVRLKVAEIKPLVRMKDDAEVEELIRYAMPLIEARAVYGIGYIEAKHENAVTVNGIRFESGVLRKNLDEAGRVFPYVVTIGEAFEEALRKEEDMLQRYYLDSVGNVALRAARSHLEELLRKKFGIDGISYMSPGSLEDWPIQEQRPLFDLLGDVKGAVGVTLNDSYLMIPGKSVSGMYFPTEVKFINCQLCPREDCPGRKAKYSAEKAEEFGVQH